MRRYKWLVLGFCLVSVLASAQAGRGGKTRKRLEPGESYKVRRESGWLTLQARDGAASIEIACRQDGQALPVRIIKLEDRERHKEAISSKTCLIKMKKGDWVQLKWASRWQRH